MPQNVIDDYSTLVQVMTWCRHVTSLYLSQYWFRPKSQYCVSGPQWASCQIDKIAGYACAGNTGIVILGADFKRNRVSDPDMHHGTCVTHVPWRMTGSLNHGGGETFLAFLAHAQPAILRIWQEAHELNIFQFTHIISCHFTGSGGSDSEATAKCVKVSTHESKSVDN